MVSPEPPPDTGKSFESTSSPRISFSSDFLDDANFICINPYDKEKAEKPKTGEFDFLSNNFATPTTMLTADELFFEGKLLPFWQKQQCSEKLSKNTENANDISKAKDVIKIAESNRMSWFIDEDPSPRPPKCTVLWKELLRLKKQRASSLSPSSSTSSSSSSSSFDDQESSKKDKQLKRSKKGLERTRSTGIKIRPMINLPVCTQSHVRSNSLPPTIFSVRKGMLDTGGKR